MRFKVAASARVVSCCEAGRDGFWLLVMEFFGWRHFRNRQEVAALADRLRHTYGKGLP